jgi:hypothetical protein
MSKRTKRLKKPKRGRPVTTGIGKQVAVRCHKDFLERVDRWREAQPHPLALAGAIRRLAELALESSGF